MAESLLTELKRRNVIRVAVAYLIIAWLVAQVSDLVFEVISAPPWVMQTLLFILAIGFVISVIISWAYEVTADGIKREVDINRDVSITNGTAKKLDSITIAAVIALIGFMLWQQFNSVEQIKKPGPKDSNSASQSTSITTEEPDKELSVEAIRSKNSIAVLPFTNRSSKKDDQYFVDGIHDDLLTKLAKIHQIKVISRTSVMEYRDTTKKIPQIAKELGVANILEGGVQRSGNHIRINAQLIHAATDEHLWAETYDKELNVDNVFSIQSEIAIVIAKALKAKLTPDEKEQINKPLTDNLIAWEIYNKAIRGNSSTLKAFDEQINYLSSAIALDPKFAVAYARLAYAKLNLYWFTADVDLRNQAWQDIEASRTIDNKTADLFAAEAAYYYWGFRDFDKALHSVNKAIALAPNSVGAHGVKGYILRRMGRFDESIEAINKAASLNPRSTFDLQENMETLTHMQRFEEAEEYMKRIDSIAPNNLDVSYVKGILMVAKGDNLELALKEIARNKEGNSFNANLYWSTLLLNNQIDQAIKFATSSLQLVDSGSSYASNDLMLGLSYFLKGDTENSKKYLQKTIKDLKSKLKLDSKNDNYLIGLCTVYAALGNAKKAHQFCQIAIKENNDAYGYFYDLNAVVEAYAMLDDKENALKIMARLLKSEVRPSAAELKLNPFMKNLRGDPIFESLVERIGSGELVEN